MQLVRVITNFFPARRDGIVIATRLQHDPNLRWARIKITTATSRFKKKFKQIRQYNAKLNGKLFHKFMIETWRSLQINVINANLTRETVTLATNYFF